MTSLKILGATLALSALVAMPAFAQSASEPAAAAASDPNFSIYSSGPGYSASMAQAPLVDASGLPLSVRPHRGVKHHH